MADTNQPITVTQALVPDALNAPDLQGHLADGMREVCLSKFGAIITFDQSCAMAKAAIDAVVMPTSSGHSELADRLLQEFFLSKYFDPKAERPADVVKAAIAFALRQTSAARSVGDEMVSNAVRAYIGAGKQGVTDVHEAMRSALVAALT
ncbi:MAG: hypothetical protein V4657_09435 [Pseudomonadota bacterium]